MEKMKIGVILGSVREERKSYAPAYYLTEFLNNHYDAEATLLDLKEWDLPRVTTPEFPGDYSPDYPDPKVKRWGEAVRAQDAFVLVTPEYNHSYPGVVKDALDVIYPEWNLKPFGLVGVSSGRFGGARALEHLRPVIAEIGGLAIHEVLNFGPIKDAFDESSQPLDSKTPDRTKHFLDRLTWWAKVLKDNRNSFPK
jgi:NAD(P)H-dependent FMN reductase